MYLIYFVNQMFTIDHNKIQHNEHKVYSSIFIKKLTNIYLHV